MIGSAIARIAKQGFNMKVIGVKRRGISKHASLVDEIIVPKEGDEFSKLRIFRESDYVVNILPGTSATYHYTGINEFTAMKDTSVFINIGRGSTVDEQALVNVLKNQIIRGAALDVFENEPLDENSELWKLNNLLLSPHNADLTEDMDQTR